MKIKHEYDDGPSYVTKGKVYEVERGTYGGTWIVDDERYKLCVLIERCCHLDRRPWTIVEP